MMSSVRKKHDARGLETEVVVVGPDGGPAALADGTSVVKTRYDPRGSVVEFEAFDLAGNVTRQEIATSRPD